MIQKFWWLSGVALLSLVGCGQQAVMQSPSAQPIQDPEISLVDGVERSRAEVSPSSSPSPGQPLSSQDFFPEPLVPNSTTLEPVPVPHLIPPTASAARIPQVESGRADPFATLGMMPTVQVKPATSRLKAAQPTVAQPLPVVTLPAPSPLPAPVVVAAPPVQPIREIPKAPAPPPLAETIEISGIIQVAGKTNIIIKVPEEATSRYVTVGERLGNGQVLVKRVEMGLEPTVVLEQSGREIVRSIGGSSMGLSSGIAGTL